jgi:pimeloyl-ACP methyl ester carboxylesterase
MPFVNVAGADIYYELTGNGRPAVVLVHGGMCDHRDWNALAGILALNHTVLTLDLRAHGKSGGDPAGCSGERWAEDVNAIITTLKLAPAIIVGHSMGTRVAAEAISQQPQNAAGLVLLDGSRAYAADGTKPASPVTAAAMPPMIDIIKVTIGPHANGQVRAQIMATMSSAPPELMNACLRAMTDWDTHRAGKAFSAVPHTLPVLAIQSTHHGHGGPRRCLESENETTPYLDFVRERVPQLETLGLTRTGHFSMMERPDEVARLIHAFAMRS